MNKFLLVCIRLTVAVFIWMLIIIRFLNWTSSSRVWIKKVLYNHVIRIGSCGVKPLKFQLIGKY